MQSDREFAETLQQMIQVILSKQDSQFRWSFEEAPRGHPEYRYYMPKYSSSLWTLLLLADLQAPPDDSRLQQAFDLLEDHFYNSIDHVFDLGKSHFPIPCLNGNMLFLHFYLQRPYAGQIRKVIEFFDTYQRFDDGGYRTPRTFPYFSNTSCYGKHTCYWGVLKLLRGLSFIPRAERTPAAQHLLEGCIEFVLKHEVCFQSHQPENFMHLWIHQLTFPALWRDDFLGILWILAREGVQDKRMQRALDLLRSKRQEDGTWRVEHPMAELILPLGRKSCGNAILTERAREVLSQYGG